MTESLIPLPQLACRIIPVTDAGVVETVGIARSFWVFAVGANVHMRMGGPFMAPGDVVTSPVTPCDFLIPNGVVIPPIRTRGDAFLAFRTAAGQVATLYVQDVG